MPATIRISSSLEDREYTCGPLLTIGRGKANDIVVRDSKVSRSHAILRCLGDGAYYVMDVGSSNGTFVNGQRVMVPRPLVDGDRVEVGEHVLMFHYDGGHVHARAVQARGLPDCVE